MWVPVFTQDVLVAVKLYSTYKGGPFDKDVKALHLLETLVSIDY
jgi:hypothetical protein